MVDQQAALALMLAAFLFVPLIARSEEVDDLKAAVEQGARAQETRDLDAFMTLIHDHIISFGPDSRLPTVGKEAFDRKPKRASPRLEVSPSRGPIPNSASSGTRVLRGVSTP